MLWCQLGCNAILMSQNMQGDAGIIPEKASFQSPWGCGESKNQLRMSENIVLLNMLGSFRKIWKEEKILLTFRVSSLLGETLSRGKCGAGQEATLIDRTLEGGPLVFEGWGDDSRMSSVCKLETQVEQFWTCQVLSGCHVRQKCILSWHTYKPDVRVCVRVCAHTLLISSFHSTFTCFHFLHDFKETDKSETWLKMVPDCTLVPGP